MKTSILAALAFAAAALAQSALAECADHARFACPEGQEWNASTKSCVSPSS